MTLVYPYGTRRHGSEDRLLNLLHRASRFEVKKLRRGRDALSIARCSSAVSSRSDLLAFLFGIVALQ